jgi:integrase
VRHARWLDSRGRTRTAPLSDNGAKILIERPGWYIVYFDASGKRVTVKGSRDKEATEALARKLEREVERAKAGLPVVEAGLSLTPYPRVVDEWIAHLEHNGSDDEYVKNMRRLVAKVAAGCRWTTMASIRADSIQAWLMDIKKHGVPYKDKENQIRRKARPPSDRTVDQYLVVTKQFINFAIPKYLPESPLSGLEKIKHPTKVLKRRAVSEAEMVKLLRIAGPRRSLYKVAALTGLRKDEIRQLEWRDVRLDCDKPFLQLRPEANKARREDRIPLSREAAKELMVNHRKELAPTDRVFPGVPRIATWKRDLKKAGITFKDGEGRQFDFHSLRYVFCTFLARANVPLRTAVELMRHRDIRLTVQVYIDAGQLDLDEAISRLPSLSDPRD